MFHDRRPSPPAADASRGTSRRSARLVGGAAIAASLEACKERLFDGETHMPRVHAEAPRAVWIDGSKGAAHAVFDRPAARILERVL